MTYPICHNIDVKRVRAAVVIVGCLSFITVAVPLFSISAANGDGSLSNTGYIEQGSTPSLIDQSAHALTTVGIDGINLTNSGGNVTAPDDSTLSLLTQAHLDGLRGELLVGNFDNSIGDFSPRIAASLLESTKNIRRVARRLSAIVVAQGWDGVTVDLESLTTHDREGLVSFVTELRHDLPSNRTLGLDVMAEMTPASYTDGGYDLSRLSQELDVVVLMAYDQHGPWSLPGPIGALNWQIQALKVLLTQVDATKVDLGVAGYGYSWPSGNSIHRGTQLSDAQARSWVLGDRINARWIGPSGEWTARLRNGTDLWWSDIRSLKLRILLAQRYGLHGVALWQLATSDPLNSLK